MKAFITGITGQDGSYLAELLLSKGYEVHGMKRRTSSFSTGRIDNIFNDIKLHHGDMTDTLSLMRLLAEIRPDEVYNLAAQSHVQVSFEQPEYTANADALGTLRILEAIRGLGIKSKFYQASTSEIFGDSPAPQNENTPFRPRSPYAVAKLYAHWITIVYREAYNIFACNGILFNHESPRRGETFVTRKITMALGKKDRVISLGNMEARRDWGHAKDYVEAMWLMLQQKQPDDYVIATGKAYSVSDLLSTATRIANHYPIVMQDDRHLRPMDVNYLLGDATKAKDKLGWAPRISFHDLIKEMILADANK